MPDLADGALDWAVQAIRHLGPALDATNIAEALWLAATIRAPDSVEDRESPDPHTLLQAKNPDPGRPDRSSATLNLYDTADQPSNPADQNLRVRGATALPAALDVERALRAFRRPWPSGRRQQLDLGTTVERYAQTGQLIPIMRPAPERWFEVAVVVDGSPSMSVWQSTVHALVRTLRHTGAFRSVRSWKLTVNDSGPALADQATGRTIHVSRLRTPDKRLLVLVISDCAGDSWQESRTWRAVWDWCRRTPTALINPLSPTLWRRTGLSLPGATVHASRIGTANRELHYFLPTLLRLSTSSDGWLPVPVLTLTPHSISRWADTLMRLDPRGCEVVLVPSSGRVDRLADRSIPDSNPIDRVARFRHIASENAVRLAALCAPHSAVSIEHLHLLRQEVVPLATVSDMAEVLVGGIGTVVSEVDGPVFHLYPDARPALSALLTANDAWRAYEVVSRYVERNFTPSGQLTLAVGGQTELSVPGRHPLADASHDILRLLGVTPPDQDPITIETASRSLTGGGTRFTSSRPPKPPWQSPAGGNDVEQEVPRRPRLYFFLSYARSDDDPYVEQFFRDLCGEVRVRAGLASSEEVGFFDTHSIGIGATWSSELVDALAESGTFVALCSPRYFVSEACGREWQIFTERVERHQLATGSRSRTIIPAFWLPPRQVPEAVQRLQYDSAAFGEGYRRDGLRQLLRLSRNQDEYIELLAVLADQIVENVDTDPLPPIPRQERVEFVGVPSAFHQAETSIESPRVNRQGALRGPDGRSPYSHVVQDHVHFVIAAPNRREARAVRRDVAYYGEYSVEWAPYRPTFRQPLADFARAVASKRRLTSEVSPLAGHWTRMPSRGIVVLLVDCWVWQIATYRRVLSQWIETRRSELVTTAMVPINPEDRETRENWPQLAGGLRRLFARGTSAGEAFAFRPEILSHRAFDEDLQVVLEVARNRLFTLHSSAEDEPSSRSSRRPVVEAGFQFEGEPDAP
ncbi:TIR-like protein FxsC [Solwaraspora sp. WMMD1047]|uniref:TIR-like protein FxsC n=1 Tax=Solwaraspora sp. WMMD1047 TaxID=3016102 RepID=UPI002416D172|nr:TIR-like protein FxsC [Solwaraspora sp. WMMD1047]MDG4827861.1 TIR-like protein FxsC [Solwaraspora sp. WMMD1047]